MISSNTVSNIKPVIYLLNAPARSGKDLGANYLAQKFGKVMKFAEPIKAAVTAIYHNGNRAEFDKYDTAALKDIPQAVYFGKTCREVQIGVSEEFMKPFHNDKMVFGRILANSIDKFIEDMDTPSLNICHGQPKFFISDSGFRQEAEVLIDKFGAENIHLFKIIRPGYTYEGDSRSYIELADLGVFTREIKNDKSIAEFYTALDYAVWESRSVQKVA